MANPKFEQDDNAFNKLPEELPKTAKEEVLVKIKVTGRIYHDGVLYVAGDIATLDSSSAEYHINNNSATKL